MEESDLVRAELVEKERKRIGNQVTTALAGPGSRQGATKIVVHEEGSRPVGRSQRINCW